MGQFRVPRFRRIALGVIVTAGVLATAGPASAATTWHVNSSGDPGDGTCDTSCTLRDAVDDATSADQIVIDPGVNPNLTAGEIAIGKNLSIGGQGAAATTVNANDLSRVFSIAPGFGLALQDLRITHGRAPDGGPGADGGDGGAVLNAGMLTMLRVQVDRSSAGNGGSSGVGPGGAGGDGGGIQSTGPVFIASSAVSENAAGSSGDSPPPFAPGGFGGGLSLAGNGTLALRDSTFSGNVAAAAGSGGAIDASGSSLLMVNSTLTGNSGGRNGGVGGGVYSSGSTDLVISSTIAGNSTGPVRLGNVSGFGGGVASTGSSTTVRNSVLANNFRWDLFSQNPLNPTSNCSGTIVDGGHNISFPADSSCPVGFMASDPALQPLASNGGATETMALGPGSTATDQVPLAACTDSDGAPLTVDQRGVGRPIGPACDIGAFEGPSPPPSPTSPPATTTKKKKCKKAKKRRSAELAKKKRKKCKKKGKKRRR